LLPGPFLVPFGGFGGGGLTIPQIKPPKGTKNGPGNNGNGNGNGNGNNP
jgi:hypothetical protein